MSKVIITCGKIGAGKSTYAEKLRKSEKAVLLSCDEITLALFDGNIGEKHDEIVERCQKYLFQKSLEIIEIGCNVILDWGLWQKEERIEAREFYKKHDVPCEIHYIHVSDVQWQANLEKRNADVLAGRTSAYFVDEGLAAKFDGLFEEPERSEVDVWVENKWNKI